MIFEFRKTIKEQTICEYRESISRKLQALYQDTDHISCLIKESVKNYLSALYN